MKTVEVDKHVLQVCGKGRNRHAKELTEASGEDRFGSSWWYRIMEPKEASPTAPNHSLTHCSILFY